MLREEKREEDRLNFCRLLAGHKKIAAVWQDQDEAEKKHRQARFGNY